MQTYVGYGFNTNDIPNETWLSLGEKYDNEAVEAFLANAIEDNTIPGMPPYIPDKSEKAELVLDFIENNNIGAYDFCEYLRIIINKNEAKKAGTTYIVSSYNNYLVFDSVRFADDSKRTKYIRNQEAFISMIQRYIPVENLTFGNLYEGTDWVDPVYTLE